MSLPPTLNASWNETGSEWTPGSRSSGKMTCSRERFCAASRASSSSSTVAASDAALDSPCCASVNAVPQPVAPGGSPVAGAYRVRAERNSCREYCRQVGVLDLDDAVGHFAEHGWALVDALPPTVVTELPGWVDEVAALADASGVLQHRELTDTGPQLCRSENFVPVHVELRALLCTRPVARRRRRAARRTGGPLQGEGELQASRRRRVLAAPGRARVPDDRRHVSAMIAVDDADVATVGSRSCRAASTPCSPRRARAASIPRRRRDPRLATGRRARRAARCGSTAALPTAAAPTAPTGPAARSTPRTTPPARVTARAEYYAEKRARVRAHQSR